MKTNQPLNFLRNYSALPPAEASVFVPAGAEVVQDASGKYWVSQSNFKLHSIEWHDAIYHGFEVEKRFLKED